MSHQYIHTSAKRGLEPGKSGFCCVARDRSIPLDLIQELERLSRYESVTGAISPSILRYETCELRSGTYHILSRIQDSGVDYSKRNNHIAQHLAFLPHEIGFLPDPMTILLCWKGWRKSWNELPRILELEDAFDINELDTKQVISNHPNEFPDLIVNGITWKRTLLISAGEELAAAAWIRLHLLHVTKELKWEIPFSTYLLSSDNPDTFAWSCNWQGRELPFEIDTEGRPWIEPKLEEEEKETEADEAPAHENTLKTLRKLRKPNTPIIEIPKELTRQDRKRPKAKWTKSRFNSTMNLAIIAGTLICLGIAANQFFYIKEPVEKLRIAAQKQNLSPEEKAAQAESERRQLKAKVTQDWLQLYRQHELLEKFEEATILAKTLAELDDPEPQKYLRLLAEAKRLSKQPPYPTTPPLEIDRIYIKNFPDRAEIANDLSHYLSKLNLSLLPREMLSPLQSLEVLSTSSQPIKSRLNATVFTPDDIIIAIKEIRRKGRDTTITKDLKAWNSIIAFNELKKDVIASEKHNELLAIQNAFELDERSSYLAFNDSGMLATPNLISYHQYLSSLFENYMLPRYSKFESNTEFTAKLNNLAPDASIREHVYEALEIAKPTDPQTEKEWQIITQAWQTTFIKEDLMQETLLNYSIEQLQEKKAALSGFQVDFTVSQFESFKRLQAINAILAELKTILANSSTTQDWVVIPQETLKDSQITSSQ